MKEKAIKKATIFDFLSGLTDKKKKWEEWSDTDVKQLSPFMVNRWLSMNTDLIEFVNDMQTYTSRLDKREFYKLFYYVLPEVRFYFDYIKRKDNSKFNPELIEYIKMYYSVSSSEAIEYIEILKVTDPEDVELTDIVSKYGVENKKIKRLLKIQKK